MCSVYLKRYANCELEHASPVKQKQTQNKEKKSTFISGE